MSESSQDYGQIVNSLLTSHRQWQQVPQIAFLTIKAICQQIDGLEDRIFRNQQLLTQQSIKVRQTDLQLENLTNQVFYERQLHGNLDPFAPQTGFKKNKKKQPPSLNKSKQTSKKKDLSLHESYAKQLEISLDDKQQNTVKFDIQEMKKLIQQANSFQMRKIQAKNEQFQKNMKQKFTNNQKQLAEWTTKLQQKLQQQQLSSSRKIIDLQTKMSINMLKNQNQFINIFQENFITKIQFTKQIKATINDIKNQIQNCQTKNMMKNESKINVNKNKKKTEKSQKNKFLEEIDEITIMNKNKEYTNKKINEIKLELSRDLTEYVKMNDIQSVINKFHEQLFKKLCKVTKCVEELEKEVHFRDQKEMIRQSSSISLRPTVSKNKKNGFKKNKMSKSPVRDNQSKSPAKSLQIIQKSLLKLENNFKDKVGSVKKQVKKEREDDLRRLEERIFEDLEKRQKYFCEIVEQNCNKKEQLNIGQIGLKKMVMKLSEQMIICRYLYYGEKQAKQYIPWEKQAYNAMEDNFIWKNGQNAVTVVESGLYKIEAGLYNMSEDFNENKVYLMVNSENAAIFSKKQLPKGSKMKGKGSIIAEPLLIPAKSKIAIRVQSPFYGQAYIQIQKL